MSNHIDTDVHCAPASIQTLFPYLDGYWRNYVADGNVRLSQAFGSAYPPGARTSATPDARARGVFPPDNVHALRKEVLDTEDPGRVHLTCTTTFDITRNPYYEAALTRAVNDWIRTEWLDQDERLRGSIVVPTMDPEAAVTEIDRLGPDERFVQVLLPVRGLEVRYGHKRYRSILAAAARHGLVVTLHAWGRNATAPTSSGFAHTYLEDYLSNSQIIQGHVVSLVAEGVFSELPELRVCLAECGFSWLPPLKWRFDKEWRSLWREVPWVKEPPETYLYRNFRATTQPAQLPDSDEEVAQLGEMMRFGDFLVYASDYPHDHGPGAERLLAALSDTEREAVMSGNAASFFR